MYKSAEVVKIVNQELGGKITREAGPLPGLGTKIVSFLDPDGWKTVSNCAFERWMNLVILLKILLSFILVFAKKFVWWLK